MTKANEFVRALQARGHSGGGETVDDSWSRQRREWLEDLVALRSSIREWLGPVVAAGLATAVDKEIALMEPDVGQYAAPGLEVTLVVEDEPRVVLIRPRGMRIAGVVETGGTRAIGARGRVDVEHGVAREILLRFRDQGQTRWISFSGGQQRALDEETFFDLLARVTELKVIDTRFPLGA
jgi:hypothetical protein